MRRYRWLPMHVMKRQAIGMSRLGWPLLAVAGFGALMLGGGVVFGFGLANADVVRLFGMAGLSVGIGALAIAGP